MMHFRPPHPSPILLTVLAGILLLTALPVSAREVIDHVGERIQIRKHPKRVVSMAPSLTEIVYALGREQILVGATQFSDYPDAARSLPRIGSYVHLDLERIVALQPDLCLAIKDGNPIDAVRRIQSAGIPVFAVNPRDLATVMDTITLLGDILNARAKAKQLVTGMQRRVDRVRNLAAQADHRPTVFVQIGITPIVSAGHNTFINELIETAGGRNAAKGSAPYPRFSKEQVLALSPDVFLITSMARDTVFEKIKAEWSVWKQMPAVRNNRIHLINSDLVDRPCPRLIDGLEVMLSLIHPSLAGGRP